MLCLRYLHPAACAQHPRPVYVAADLAATPLAEALESKGFDRTKPAVFTCEGILVYLPPVRPLSPGTMGLAS